MLFAYATLLAYAAAAFRFAAQFSAAAISAAMPAAHTHTHTPLCQRHTPMPPPYAAAFDVFRRFSLRWLLDIVDIADTIRLRHYIIYAFAITPLL